MGDTLSRALRKLRILMSKRDRDIKKKRKMFKYLLKSITSKSQFCIDTCIVPEKFKAKVSLFNSKIKISKQCIYNKSNKVARPTLTRKEYIYTPPHMVI